jgi:hypothetical protein
MNIFYRIAGLQPARRRLRPAPCRLQVGDTVRFLARVLLKLLSCLRPAAPLRHYRVTPRRNASAFRRALLRAALLELKRDPAFATLPARRHTGSR